MKVRKQWQILQNLSPYRFHIATYKILRYLGDGKITDADLTVSKTIESLAKKESKKHGYKNGKE